MVNDKITPPTFEIGSLVHNRFGKIKDTYKVINYATDGSIGNMYWFEDINTKEDFSCHIL